MAINDRMHGYARRKMRGWLVGGVQGVASMISMVIIAVSRGMLV